MPLEGLCVSRAAPTLPVFALRGASGMTGDQWGPVLELNEQNDGPREQKVTGLHVGTWWDGFPQTRLLWGQECLPVGLVCPAEPMRPLNVPWYWRLSTSSLGLLWRWLAGGS